MRKLAVLAGCIFTASVFIATAAMGQQTASSTTEPATKPWIAKSDSYTNQLLDIQLKHGPEGGSARGGGHDPRRARPPGEHPRAPVRGAADGLDPPHLRR